MQDSYPTKHRVERPLSLIADIRVACEHQTMLRIYLREIGAALIVTAFISVVGLLAWLINAPPTGQPKTIDAVVVGFNTSYSRALLQSSLTGSVRLPNGQIQDLSWPALITDCRTGDVVRLEQYDHGRFLVPPQQCHPAS